MTTRKFIKRTIKANEQKTFEKLILPALRNILLMKMFCTKEDSKKISIIVVLIIYFHYYVIKTNFLYISMVPYKWHSIHSKRAINIDVNESETKEETMKFVKRNSCQVATKFPRKNYEKWKFFFILIYVHRCFFAVSFIFQQ